MDLNSEKGAVTAEFMLLLPALLVLLAAALSLFQLGLERIALETKTFEIARSVAIGYPATEEAGFEIATKDEGRFRCVSVTKQGLVNLESTRCMIPYGG